jgi:superoxide reductase
MPEISEHIHHADWKIEKHVPAIEAADSVKAGEAFAVSVTVGKEIAHPNTTEHHITWVDLYFFAEGDKFAHQVAHFEFSAHGESGLGPNQGPAYTVSQATAFLKINKPGMLHAVAMCNIHGLWESSKAVAVA